MISGRINDCHMHHFTQIKNLGLGPLTFCYCCLQGVVNSVSTLGRCDRGDVIGGTLWTLEGALGKGRGSWATSSNPFSAGLLHLVQCTCPVGFMGYCACCLRSVCVRLAGTYCRCDAAVVLFGELMGDEDTFPE